MEYRFNDEQNSKILVILIFLIVFVGLIGGLIFYTSNDKLAVMTRVDKVFKEIVNNEFEKIESKKFKDFVSDSKFKVSMEQVIDDNPISNELLMGDLHINFGKENEYKIINLNTNMQGDIVETGLYEKDGFVYIKMNGNTYQLNKEHFKVTNDNYDIKDIQEMYNLIYKVAKKQLNDLDFYRITEEATKQVRIGISLTDERVKEIIIDTLDELKMNEKFIELYSKIKEIEKDKVVEEIDAYIKKVEAIEFDDSNVTKLDIYTSGLLNTETDKIVLTRTESAIIKFTSTIITNDNNVSIDIEKNNRSVNIELINNNGEYNVIINGDDFSFKINIQKYAFVVNASYGEYNLYIQYNSEEQDEEGIEGNGTVGISLGTTNRVIATFDEKVSFESQEESVDLGEIKPIEELFGGLMLVN